MARFDLDNYIGVSERIVNFYAKFPQGRIITTIIEHNEETGFILMRAEVYREPDDALPAATGHAYELRSAGQAQAGSYIEVCESSAAGRALFMLGFPVQRNTGSTDTGQSQRRVPAAQSSPGGVTAAQLALLRRSAVQAGVDLDVESQRVYNKNRDELTKKEANDLIDTLKSGPQVV